MNNIQIIMGTDPGLQGSIAVLIGEAPIVWDVPTLQTESVKNGKKIKRRDYDLEAMRNLLLPFHGQNVIFPSNLHLVVQEKDLVQVLPLAGDSDTGKHLP